MASARPSQSVVITALLAAAAIALVVYGRSLDPGPTDTASAASGVSARAAPGGHEPGAEESSSPSATGSDDEPGFLPVDMPEPPTPPEARGDASGPDAVREIFSDYGFPGYPDLAHWCGMRSLQPAGRRQTSDAFTTDQKPAAVVAHFQRWLGERGFTAEQPGGTWRLPPGSPAPSRSLQITTPDRHQGCDGKAPPKAETVIVLTRH